MFALAGLIAACDQVQDTKAAKLAYPVSGTTYLIRSPGHGYQVNYLENGKGWLWYPGNKAVVSEVWKIEQIGTRSLMCWLHPASTVNPVIGARGGKFICEPIDGIRAAIVAAETGDIFELKSGKAPYVLQRNKAPEGFGE